MFHATINRIKDNGTATIGVFSFMGLILFSLEDEHRGNKISGETRIPQGKYKISACKNSGLLTRMRENGWWIYDWIPTIENVPGFTNIRIHAGNYESQTDGCPLLGLSANLDSMTIGHSRSAVLKFGELLEPCFNAGDVYLTITDER